MVKNIRPENIHQDYTYITRKANTPGVFNPIVVLEIPGSTVFRMENETPLVLKLYKSDGSEISSASEVCLCWISSNVDNKIIHYTREEVMDNEHCSNILNYGVFRRIPIGEQENINTQVCRLIRFNGGETSILTGLLSDCKVLLMLRSDDVVDWGQTDCEFNFNMIVLTETEYKKEILRKYC